MKLRIPARITAKSVILIITITIFCSLITVTEGQVKYFDLESDLFAEETNNPRNLKIRKLQVRNKNVDDSIYLEKLPIARSQLLSSNDAAGGASVASPAATNNNGDQTRSFGTILRAKKFLLLKFTKLLPAGIPLLTLPIILRSADGTEIPVNNIDELKIIEVPDEQIGKGNEKHLNSNENLRFSTQQRPQKLFVLENVEIPKSVDFQELQQQQQLAKNLKPGETRSRFLSLLTTQKRKVIS